MFQKYNINDLYLAYVLEIRPVDSYIIPYTSIGYYTILKKYDSNYIDLQNKNRIVKTNITQNEKCYVIYEIEPLANYYTQDGKKNNKLSKEKVLTISEKYKHVISNKIYERTKSI